MRWHTDGADLDPKIDGLVDSTRVVRDTVHDISNGMQVLPSREEMKDDMREYRECLCHLPCPPTAADPQSVQPSFR